MDVGIVISLCVCHNFDMEISKKQLGAVAQSLGFADIRYASAADLPDKKGLQQPQALLPGAACIVVLFAPYHPALPSEPGSMALSAYYIASNRSYHAARAVAEYLQQQGAKSLHTDAVSAKSAALRTGGFLGDNGFYYHPVLGSHSCIQTVLTDAFEPEEALAQEGGCLHCGACAAACPSHAVGDIEGCLRYHSNGLVPEALRGDVYQLLGCERCQDACPLNNTQRSRPVSFTLKELLGGNATKTLRELAGPNMARRGRILSQTALYAAVTKQYELRSLLKQLAENEAEPVAAHARWAIERLNGANQ